MYSMGFPLASITLAYIIHTKTALQQSDLGQVMSYEAVKTVVQIPGAGWNLQCQHQGMYQDTDGVHHEHMVNTKGVGLFRFLFIFQSVT